MTALAITNRDARRLWLDAQGLSATPTGPIDLMAIIQRIGFVQLDTIRVVARAHDHILWSRNQHYREPMLSRLLAKDRSIFEHFTHDASVLPMEFYPMWQRQFRRLKEKMDRSTYYGQRLQGAEYQQIKQRIWAEGPLSTHAFDTKVASDRKEMWARPPHKLALDYMWYCGELATSHRKNFTKFYDVSERVIPDHHRANHFDDQDQIDWLCKNAIDRLAFATPGEIQRFWDAVGSDEVRAWLSQTDEDLVPVTVECADGSWTNAFAPPNIDRRLADLAEPSSRLRILNPFDPVIRDRNRLKRLFGFDYRIEIFVPANKRQWGYYVLPLLERDRFVGRIEAKADRKTGTLSVINAWPEPGVKWTNKRLEKLEAELARFARFANLNEVCWDCTAPRS